MLPSRDFDTRCKTTFRNKQQRRALALTTETSLNRRRLSNRPRRSRFKSAKIDGSPTRNSGRQWRGGSIKPPHVIDHGEAAVEFTVRKQSGPPRRQKQSFRRVIHPNITLPPPRPRYDYRLIRPLRRINNRGVIVNPD